MTTTHQMNVIPLIDYMLALYVVVSNLNENGLDNGDEVAKIVTRLAEHAKASMLLSESQDKEINK